ncbi:BrnT family toxin [Undibacterium arcticum]|uniref:BrnT family toxin n=1 Tax=Undibacterium arcticum TaxID=1762892 RepID=A0ABV7FAL3_9BURK
MEITFDPLKNQVNLKKHGVSLLEARIIDWETALVWRDDRREYGEVRECALGMIGDRVYCVVFVDREEARRIISLRKANLREAKYYVEQT